MFRAFFVGYSWDRLPGRRGLLRSQGVGGFGGLCVGPVWALRALGFWERWQNSPVRGVSFRRLTLELRRGIGWRCRCGLEGFDHYMSMRYWLFWLRTAQGCEHLLKVVAIEVEVGKPSFAAYGILIPFGNKLFVAFEGSAFGGCYAVDVDKDFFAHAARLLHAHLSVVLK